VVERAPAAREQGEPAIPKAAQGTLKALRASLSIEP
jgi:hypothetical protein